jgi:peroxiredoxin
VKRVKVLISFFIFVSFISFIALNCSSQTVTSEPGIKDKPINAPASEVKDKTVETKAAEIKDKPVEIKSTAEKDNRKIKIGDEAPQFTLTDSEGKAVSLSDFRGQKVIINMFWLQCHGCTDEMPYFEEFFQKHDRAIALLAISVYDSENILKAFAEAKGLTFSLFADPEKKLDKAYVNAGVPTTFFIDQNGVVKAIKDGGFENVEEIDTLYNSY